ncbi:MAG: SLC45 family MFS transporter [Bacteroidales bacterium]|nr:SLC45 family MFS transporter [Bacteroidales bacterium]
MKKNKPELSFWQIWNMSFGFLGIQFGFALQNANVSRIFETLGAKVENIPILWIAAPVTGLIVQPIIGHMSDNTWNRLGRRRPYFLTGAILASLALLIMPNSPFLWVAAGMLWIMDASINISMEPFRAFVGDMLPSSQRTKGFAMQSFFIGTGAVVASILPYLMTNVFNISNTAPAGQVPLSVKLSFYIGSAAFFSAVLWTVLRTKEYPPDLLREYSGESDETTGKDKTTGIILPPGIFIRRGLWWIAGGIILTALIWYFALEPELFILSAGGAAFGLIQLLSGTLVSGGRSKNGFVVVINDLFLMPVTMKQLAIVQFFSWFALFSMWIYTTSAVTSHIYGTSDTTSELYNRGANWVGVLFAVYNGFAALVAFLLPVIAKRTNRKLTHSISLAAGGLGLISIIFFKSPELLIISMLGVGLAWASILAMPYAILTGSLPSAKMGTYMGIFNFFIVIPQILAASILGFMVRHLFSGHSIYALVTGGISMFIGAALVMFVEDKD